MKNISLSPTQESEFHKLKAKMRDVMDKELDSLSRLLVSRCDKELFGQTEFQIRDIVLRIGAKAYEEYLREKKTATMPRE